MSTTPLSFSGCARSAGSNAAERLVSATGSTGRLVVLDVDWERLEAEFADVADPAAREVDGRLVDRIVATARRRHVRRAGLIGGVAALLVAVVVGVALTAVLVPDRRPAMDAVGRDFATQAQIYAAALRAGLHSSQPVWVHSSACVSRASRLAAGPSRPCADRLIPAPVRAQVRAALGGDVRFAAHPPVPNRVGDPPVVQLGPLVLTGAQARLGIAMRCGLRCTEGETLVLRRQDGRWHVTGSVGPRWVS